MDKTRKVAIVALVICTLTVFAALKNLSESLVFKEVQGPEAQDSAATKEVVQNNQTENPKSDMLGNTAKTSSEPQGLINGDSSQGHSSGGISDAILQGSGTIEEIDPSKKTIVIKIDEGTDCFGAQEVNDSLVGLFDYSKKSWDKPPFSDLTENAHVTFAYQTACNPQTGGMWGQWIRSD